MSGSGDLPSGCLACRHAHFHFDGAISLGDYRDALRKAVLQTKRSYGEPMANALGRLLVEQRRKQLESACPSVVAPVPMYWRRRLARRTNSPDVVAEQIGRALGLPVAYGMLKRRRNTLPQKDLSPKERFQNVRGAFVARNPARLSGARILLVDDILTTGATCSEAAKVLKQQGAAHVVAVVLARAD
jgi:ComF family protein